MSKKLLIIAGAAVALLLAAVAAYLLLGKDKAKPKEEETSINRPAIEPATDAASEPKPAAPVSGPLAEATPVVSEKPQLPPLPDLNQSDSFVLEKLLGLLGDQSLVKLFVPEGVIKRIVATVINLPQQRVAPNITPFVAPPGHFFTQQQGSLLINPANEKRYVSYVRIAQAVDARKLVALYVRLYPLLQEEYEKLGYPSQLFNDQLLETVDDLIETPEVAAPVGLVQPKYYYLYANPGLEDLSIGQKIMIRLGSANMKLVRHKLQEIKKELALHSKELDES